MTRKFTIRDIAHLADVSNRHLITLSRCGLPVVAVNTTAVHLVISSYRSPCLCAIHAVPCVSRSIRILRET